MRLSAFKGFSFGLTSGIITTLGMMVGLESASGSQAVVIGGILSIAIADSFSDALGIHVAEESDHSKCENEVWVSTVFTFLSKLIFSSTFLVPVMLLDLEQAVYVSTAYGLSLLALLSYFIARSQKTSPLRVISEHLGIAVLVIIATRLVGIWIGVKFGL